MTRLPSVRILIAFLPILLSLPAIAGAAPKGGDCLACHQQKTPGVMRAFENSAHAGKVACRACHGDDHDAMRAGTAPVTVEACAACHPKAAAEHRASRHGLGLHSGWGCTRNLPAKDRGDCSFCHESGSDRPLSSVHCARYLKQSPAMREIGCNRCHRVEASCAACHGGHATDLASVRSPRVCARCHMGPDHPQWEMWQTSAHGSLAVTTPDGGPTCQTCHMPGGSHDVSAGISNSVGLQPLPDAAARRAAMLGICATCHARDRAERDLNRADQVRQESLALIARGRSILQQLAGDGLLDPSPEDRPPHPLRGHELVTDSQMLYEDLSHAERIFFKMQKFDLAQTVMGAYHQNPAYTHWYGNAELKLDLSDLQADASRLHQARNQAGSGGQARNQAETALETELRHLQRQHQSGVIDAASYRARKEKLLQRYLAPAAP